jgi:hypothetical protein
MVIRGRKVFCARQFARCKYEVKVQQQLVTFVEIGWELSAHFRFDDLKIEKQGDNMTFLMMKRRVSGRSQAGT